MKQPSDGSQALDELYWRAEILQAMYWMQGEGLAAEAGPDQLAEFLDTDRAVVAEQMGLLRGEGYLEAAGEAGPPYRLTPRGLDVGGRSFRDEFEGLTRQAHFECGPGCWCKDPKHAEDPCPRA